MLFPPTLEDLNIIAAIIAITILSAFFYVLLSLQSFMDSEAHRMIKKQKEEDKD